MRRSAYSAKKLLLILAASLLSTVWALPIRAQLPSPHPPASVPARRDSLAQAATLPSQLVLRLDYSPQTLFAGRDFGVRQSTTTPSLTYYHRSGAYVGVSGSIYSVSTPHYLLTDFTGGYGNLLGKHFLYNLSYDHYAFSEAGQGTLTNAVGGLLSYDFGLVSLSSSYSLLFGNGETGHRLTPSLNGYHAWKKLGFIDKLFIAPAVSATIGTDNIAYQIFPSSLITGKTGKPTTKNKKNTKAAQPVDENITSFGLMSWNFSVPVKIRIGGLTTGITYNYIIPIQLEHESAAAGFTPKSFFSFSASYAF